MWIVFNFSNVVMRENAGRKWCQDAIRLLQGQRNESSRLQTVPSPLPFGSSPKSFQPTPHLSVNQ